MKLGHWYINPSAVIGATVSPRSDNPRMVKLYVMGIPEPVEINAQHATPAEMQDAKEFVQRLEASWGDGTPLFACATAAPSEEITRDYKEIFRYDR